MHIVLRCSPAVAARVRYVFDTLLMPLGIETAYPAEPPSSGAWLLYSARKAGEPGVERAAAIAHHPQAWEHMTRTPLEKVALHDDLCLPFSTLAPEFEEPDDLPFDLVANAFYFLASCSERTERTDAPTRAMYATSVFSRLDIPQDIVDRYQVRLMKLLERLVSRRLQRLNPIPEWPGGGTYAVVLSHDVDYLPQGPLDMALQGAKSMARSLIKYRDVPETFQVGAGLARAVASRTDPYGCVPEIIRQEKELGVRASFQVAVGHRHPADVNYFIEDDRTRDYLLDICEQGFDLCLHGSYRSADDPSWYQQEAELLTKRLRRPLGSRQHFLSFKVDALFRAQEAAGIQYDMSMGFPDRPGPRAGFSFPYFPYCIDEDRPYRVLQLSLFLMDVTLRGYMRLRAEASQPVIDAVLDDLRAKRGCASVVWHPIVFGGARDPGFDRAFWRLVSRVRDTGGVCTDGATINTHWRHRAARYAGLASHPASH